MATKKLRPDFEIRVTRTVTQVTTLTLPAVNEKAALNAAHRMFRDGDIQEEHWAAPEPRTVDVEIVRRIEPEASPGTRRVRDLSPADPERCEARMQDGVSFMTLGTHPWRRCEAKPVVVLRDRQAGSDGKRQSMSLCASCLVVFKERNPDWEIKFTVRKVRP